MARYALKYEKGENVRWLSHLDIMRTWERALRRSDIPLLYSEGFNPRPKMWFLAPIGVGVTGGAEMMAFDLELPFDPEEIKFRLSECLPEGLSVKDIWRVEQQGTPFGTEIISTFTFKLSIPRHYNEDEVRNAIHHIESQEVVDVRRERDDRVKTVNIRPKIKRLEIMDFKKGSFSLEADLIQSSDFGVRPSEVIDLFRSLLPGLDLIEMNRVNVQEKK